MPRFSLALKYALFASLAMLANIGVQRLALLAYGGRYSLYIAMGLGTMTGLVVKYILDKRYIFYYKTDTRQQDLLKFLLYSLMGVFTTAVFWGTELLFDFFLPFGEAKFIGAAVGLTIGYTTKYFLDKRFVFRKASAQNGRDS